MARLHCPSLGWGFRSSSLGLRCVCLYFSSPFRYKWKTDTLVAVASRPPGGGISLANEPPCHRQPGGRARARVPHPKRQKKVSTVTKQTTNRSKINQGIEPRHRRQTALVAGSTGAPDNDLVGPLQTQFHRRQKRDHHGTECRMRAASAGPSFGLLFHEKLSQKAPTTPKKATWLINNHQRDGVTTVNGPSLSCTQAARGLLSCLASPTGVCVCVCVCFSVSENHLLS